MAVAVRSISASVVCQPLTLLVVFGIKAGIFHGPDLRATFSLADDVSRNDVAKTGPSSTGP